jgi:hypothetical protein
MRIKPSVPSASSREEFLAAAPAEKASAIDGFYAYYGTWTVDPSGSTVTHHIQQSLYPGERGEEGVRQLTLDGSRLVLLAKTHEMAGSPGQAGLGAHSAACALAFPKAVARARLSQNHNQVDYVEAIYRKGYWLSCGSVRTLTNVCAPEDVIVRTQALGCS